MKLDDQFFRAAFEAAADAMLVVSSGGGEILDANDAFVRLYGASRAEVLGMGTRELGGISIDESEERWRTLRRDRRVHSEVEFQSCGGETLTAELTATLVTDDRILVVLRDITERKARELSAERYRLLSRYANDIVLFMLRDGQLVEANDAACEVYGYTREEILALRIHDLRDVASRDEVDAQITNAFDKGVRFDARHQRKDGTTFPVEVSSRSAIVGGTWMLLSIIRDVTERNDLHGRLVQADRLSAFGLMAAGIAHEINNPLAYAMTNGELLERMLVRAKADLAAAAPETAMCMIEKVRAQITDREQSLHTMREGLSRVRTIVRDLATFSRDDRVAQLVDIRTVLESTMRLSHGELEHRAQVVRNYDSVPHVIGNPARLGQVFLNLVINAAQAIEEGGTIEIRATHDDERVFVDVIDDGPGIEESIRERVFAPFFTTKRAGEGTGLGLYISRTLVSEMGGTIEALSREPRGTAMRVTLPRAASDHKGRT